MSQWPKLISLLLFAAAAPAEAGFLDWCAGLMSGRGKVAPESAPAVPATVAASAGRLAQPAHGGGYRDSAKPADVVDLSHLEAEGPFARLVIKKLRSRGMADSDIARITPASLRFIGTAPGTFMMGSPAHEEGRFEDEPLHEVELTESFFGAATPWTQAVHFAFTGENPSHFKTRAHADSDHAKVGGIELLLNHPAESMTEAEEDAAIALLPKEWNCRKLSEAELEYITRAGTTTRYPWGDREKDLKRGGWPHSGRTHGVAMKEPNAWGFFDVVAHIWQRTTDVYHDSYGLTAEQLKSKTVNPINLSQGHFRVARSGSWNGNAARYARSAQRFSLHPGNRGSALGFRVACFVSDMGL